MLLVKVAHGRTGKVSFRAPRLALLRIPPMPPGTHHKKLGLTHGAFQAEQEPIIEGRWIIDPLFIQDQVLGKRTHFQEMMQITGVAREPGDFQPQNQSYMAESYLSYQSLERKARSAVDAPE
jgi:hypothetical protein